MSVDGAFWSLMEWGDQVLSCGQLAVQWIGVNLSSSTQQKKCMRIDTTGILNNISKVHNSFYGLWRYHKVVIINVPPIGERWLLKRE